MSKIMIVEDDKSLREIYSIRLVAEGYNVVSAGDGEEALAMAVRERPELIISDVMMPKISGFDMLDIIRSTPETKDIKIIMMTALSSEDQRQRGESLGADMYLVKSQVGIEDVVNAVHQILGDRPTAHGLDNINTLASLPDSQAAVAPAAAPPAPEVSPAPQIPPVAEPTPVEPAPAAASPDINIPHSPEAAAPPPAEVPPAPEVSPAPQVLPETPPAVAPAAAPPVPPAPVATPVPVSPAPAPAPVAPEVPPPAPAPVAPPAPEVSPAPQIPPATPEAPPPAPASENVIGERVIQPLPSVDVPDGTPSMEQKMAEILGTANPPAAPTNPPPASPDAPASK